MRRLFGVTVVPLLLLVAACSASDGPQAASAGPGPGERAEDQSAT